jgi:hypothetical protein
MITTIRSKIGVTLALVLAAVSFAPAALADPPQLQLRRHAPDVQVKEDPLLARGHYVQSDGAATIKDDPLLARGHDVFSGGAATLVNGREGTDGSQPQLSVTDNPVLLRGYGGTEPRGGDAQLVRGDRPDGFQPQLRGVQPSVSIASTDGTDWVAAGSGLGIGVALSALMLGAWAVSRRGRLAHS